MIIHNEIASEGHTRQIQKLVNKAELYTVEAVKSLKNAHALLWGLPDEELISTLNSIGPLNVQAMFESHLEQGPLYNSILDSYGGNGPRINIEPGRKVQWNGSTNSFEFAVDDPGNPND